MRLTLEDNGRNDTSYDFSLCKPQEVFIYLLFFIYLNL